MTQIFINFALILSLGLLNCDDSSPIPILKSTKRNIDSLETTTCEESSLQQSDTSPSEAIHENELFSTRGLPRPADINQAGFNVCYVYAFLSAYSAFYPMQIKDSIRRIPRGFEVKVFDDHKKNSCVFISNEQFDIFYKKGRARDRYIWPEVLTGAWVSHLKEGEMLKAVDEEIKKTGTDKNLGVSELLRGKIIDLSLVMKDPFQYFLNKKGKMRRIKPKTGTKKRSDFLVDHNDLFNFVSACLKAGCVMYAYVAPEGGGVRLPSGLYDHHCYGVMGVDPKTQSIALRNPHGGRAQVVSYASDNKTPLAGIQENEQFFLRSKDFYRWFYTLQFSEF